MTRLRAGGRILVDCLATQGCDRIFTVPGESVLQVLDTLYDVPAIDLVVCRHESGATFMAEADGKLTGRPGIAFVTRAPGEAVDRPRVDRPCQPFDESLLGPLSVQLLHLKTDSPAATVTSVRDDK